MCDTLIVTGSAAADGVALFAKNSDREPNERRHLGLRRLDRTLHRWTGRQYPYALPGPIRR